MSGNKPQVKLDSDLSLCVSCHRVIRFDELFGAFGLCSQCLGSDFEEHHGA